MLEQQEPRMSSAAPVAYPEDEPLYRISEVSRLTGLEPFVLRYWESEFPMLQPVKSQNKHRMYRQQDVDLVFRIKRLLYEQGFTTAGARRHLQELAGKGSRSVVDVAAGEAVNGHGRRAETAASGSAGPAGEDKVALDRQTLLELRDCLRSFLTLLERK
jgi:DNA-binding transcriptional MerR regulator